MTTPQADELLLIGRIAGAFGVKGELKLALVSSRPDHLRKIKTVYVGDQTRTYNVGRFHEHKANQYIVRLREIEDRDAAELLKGEEVFIRISDAAPLAADEYFLHDLNGLTVKTQDGTEIGKVVEIIETGANDVLVVRQIGQPDVLVPMVRSFITTIDVANGLIEITSLSDIVPE